MPSGESTPSGRLVTSPTTAMLRLTIAPDIALIALKLDLANLNSNIPAPCFSESAHALVLAPIRFQVTDPPE